MPIKRIQFPDGSIKRVEVPDGATDEQILAFVQSQYQGEQTQAQPEPELPLEERHKRAGIDPNQYDPTEGNGFWQNALEGFGASLVGTAEGIGQAVGLVDEEQVAERRRLNAPLMDTWGGMLGNIGGQAAQIAVPVGGAARSLSFAGRARPYVESAIRAGAFGGAQGTVGDESRLANAGTDAALGAAGQGIASGAGWVARRVKDGMSGPVRRSIETARNIGIPLRADQVTTSPLVRGAAAVSRWMPFSGAASQARKQQEAFNEAVGRTFGLENGRVLDRVTMQGARRAISDQFEDIYSRNDVPITMDGLRRLAGSVNRAGEDLVEAEASVVQKQLDKILREAENGTLTGRKYQALRSNIMKAEGEDRVGTAVKTLRKELDDIAAESVGPEDAATLKRIRSQWANLRTTEDALKQVSGAKGNVQPSSLYPLIRRGATPEMRELAEVGQNVLKDVVPDSGTAQRMFYQNLLTGAGAAGAGLTLGMLTPLAKAGAAGVGIGRLLNSNAGSRLLEQGAPTSGLAKLLRSAPSTAPAVFGSGGVINIGGGQVGAWTPEDDAELIRLRAEMEARRSAAEGR